MKRFRFLFTLLLSLFFLGCSNSFQNNLTVSESNSNNCTIYVQSKNNIINFSKGVNRSILPSTIDSSTLHFYLWGKNKLTGESLSVTEVEFSPTENSTTGTVDINFANSTSYELYLGATKNAVTINGVYNNVAIDNIKKELCYLGFATADLRYATQVLFFLSPYAVTSGYGTANLKLYTSWAIPANYTAKAGLYNKNTDEEIKMIKTTASGVVHPTTVQGIENFYSNRVEPATANYRVDHITPGSYNFKITFSGPTKNFVYSDTIVILANQETNATICVPNILEYKPTAAPSELTVAYADPDSAAEDFYPVEFTWKDNSMNETYFQLEVLDISNAPDTQTNRDYISKIIDTTNTYTLAEKDAAWALLGSSKSALYKFNPDYYGDSSNPAFIDVCTDGALCCNNNFVVVNLMLGNKYLARICAVNYMGSTEYAYIDICNDGNYTIPTSKLSYTFNQFPANTNSINRYKIQYYLNNGRFRDTSTSADVTKQIKTYEFASQNTLTTTAILNPVAYPYDPADSNKKATLSSTAGFTKWTKDYVGGVEQGSTYDGYENLNLFAYYDGTKVSNGYDLSSGNFAVYAGNDSVLDASTITKATALTITNEYFTVNSSQYKYLYFLCANRNPNGIRDYSSVKLIASENYGLTTEYVSPGLVSAGFTECSYIIVDISDPTKYKNNDQLYYAEFHITPTNGNGEDLTYMLKFRVE